MTLAFSPAAQDANRSIRSATTKTSTYPLASSLRTLPYSAAPPPVLQHQMDRGATSEYSQSQSDHHRPATTSTLNTTSSPSRAAAASQLVVSAHDSQSANEHNHAMDDQNRMGYGSQGQTPNADYDPNLQRSTPGYPTSQYAYAPPHDMPHGGYAQHPPSATEWRQQWPPQSGGVPYAGMTSPYSPSPTTNVSVASSPAVAAGRSPGQMNQVYSFVPIPGATQHKRPRRKFEEIERMYTCGFNGCQKAYGTLNHLNAHVTMQNHGPKRVPDEFKEIRREWKARKKEEDMASKKSEEEKLRQQQAEAQGHGHHDGEMDPQGQSNSGYGSARPQLPPINNYPGQSSQMGYYGAPASGEQMGMYNSQGYPPYSTAYPSGSYQQEYPPSGSEYPPAGGQQSSGPGAYRQ